MIRDVLQRVSGVNCWLSCPAQSHLAQFRLYVLVDIQHSHHHPTVSQMTMLHSSCSTAFTDCSSRSYRLVCRLLLLVGLSVLCGSGCPYGDHNVQITRNDDDGAGQSFTCRSYIQTYGEFHCINEDRFRQYCCETCQQHTTAP